MREIIQHIGTTIDGRPTVVWLLDDGRVPPLAVAHWPETEPPGTAHTYADCLDALTAWAQWNRAAVVAYCESIDRRVKRELALTPVPFAAGRPNYNVPKPPFRRLDDEGPETWRITELSEHGGLVTVCIEVEGGPIPLDIVAAGTAAVTMPEPSEWRRGKSYR